MVVVVKPKSKRTARGPHLMSLMPTDSVSSMRSSTERSVSSSSLKKGNLEACHTKSPAVSFAQDYGCSDSVYPAAPPLTADEAQDSFYNHDDLNKFDKDRALTVLMYRTRKNNGVPWDDDVHSLRGLEEILRKHEKSRREKREEYIKAVLEEQARLRNSDGQEELEQASRAIHKSPDDLRAELLRGVSCAHSKLDKHRAVALAMKDQKVSSEYNGGAFNRHGSARKLMKQVKTKLYGWASTSTKSLGATSERSSEPTTASEKDAVEQDSADHKDAARR